MIQITLMVLAALGALGFVLALYCLVLNGKNKIKNKELEGEFKAASGKIEVLENSLIELGKRAHKLETELQEVQLSSQNEVAPPSEDSILKANALLQQGKSVAEISAECDLPEHEVQLMQAVRRSKSVTLNPEVSD